MTPEEFITRFPDHPASRELLAQGVKQGGEQLGPKSKPKPKPKRSTSTAGKEPSHLEALFAQHLLAYKAPAAHREYRFHPERAWRMDFAWPEHRVAVEIEGGVWGLGRHNRPRGFIADTEKYNAAAKLGWTVLRFTAQTIRSGEAIEQTVGLLRDREALDAIDPESGTQRVMHKRARPKQ